MGYLGRRIGKSQDTANPTADGTGGGILDLFANGYFERQDKNYNFPGIAPVPEGLTATGGVISDYTVGSDVYRAHVFTSTGTFEVTELSTDYPNAIDYLVVAGGGGGSDRGNGAGGGGAGGLLSSHPDIPSTYRQTAFTAVAPRIYTMTVGAGGGGGSEGLAEGFDRKNRGVPGTDSRITYPGNNTVVHTYGGGCGGQGNTGSTSPYALGDAGGSGGGSDNPSTAGGDAHNFPGPTQQGHPGGDCTPPESGGGGGGGAGGAGGDCNGTSGSAGGIGRQVRIAGPQNSGVGTPGPGSEFAYFAGGGGGGRNGSGGGQSPGGYGGGGQGAYQSHNCPVEVTRTRYGLAGTGGGGGSGADGTKNDAGSGGSGIIIVRYKIGSIPTEKATGGSVSFYNDKTIHVFTSSGTFATTSDWEAADVDYIVIGGGGGAGYDGGGGGGAGAWREGSTPIGAHPVSTTIQVGAGGMGSLESGATPGYGGNANGSPSFFGSPITAPGGGGGGGGGGQPGGEGGSGGGGRGGSSTGTGGNGTGEPYPGSPPRNSPPNGWGNNGGDGSGPGGGGGGAGGTGFAGNDSTAANRGVGGTGLQLPSTYHNPKATYGFPGPNSQGFWFAGGGGGGSYPLIPGGVPGGGVGGPYAGAGEGQGPEAAPSGTAAQANSGSGGGGGKASAAPPKGRQGADGGSGIVILSYPT